MYKSLAELDASVQAKIESDSEFQSQLEGLTDEEKSSKITERKTQLMDTELAEISKSKEVAENQRIRAEKSEKEVKDLKKNLEKKETSLTPADIIAIAKSDVPEEALPEIIEYATFKKIGVVEAIKSPVVQKIVAEAKEKIESAKAVNMGKTGAGSGKISDSALLENAKKGIIPESQEDIKRLYVLRHKS